MKVADISIQIRPLSPGDSISAALMLMHSKKVDIAPVMEGDELIGAVIREDLFSALRGGAFMTTSIPGWIMRDGARLSPDQNVFGIPVSSIPALVLNDDGKVPALVSLESYS